MQHAPLSRTHRRRERAAGVASLILGSVLCLALTSGSAYAGNPPIVELDMTPAEYQDMFDNGLPPSYRPISATATGPLGSERFSAAWIDDDVLDTDWIAKHGLTFNQLVTEMDLHRPNGFRVFSCDAYGTVPNERYVALWVRDGVPNNEWFVVPRVTEGALAGVIQAQVNAGRAPIWISSTGVGTAHHTLVFTQNAKQWTYGVETDMDASLYQEEVTDKAKLGARPISISVYGTDEDPRFSAVWFLPEGPQWEHQNLWEARHDQGENQHGDFTNDAINAGYIPNCISKYGNANLPLFAASWYKPNQEAVLTLTGTDVPALSPLDDVMVDYILDRKITHAALAVTKDGRLEFARGYTYAGDDAKLTQPGQSLFRTASISKSITAVGIMKLIEDTPLTLDSTIGDFAELANIGWVDPKVNNIRIRHLLQHRAGWDTDLPIVKRVFEEGQLFPTNVPEPGFDPMFRNWTISNELDVEMPIGKQDILQYMRNFFLNYNPGTSYDYLNFGYLILGRMIESYTGDDYDEWIIDNVLCPIGAGGMRLGRTLREHQHIREVPYNKPMKTLARNVHGVAPDYRENQYGAWVLENMDAHGGWTSTVVDMARFISAFTDKANSPLLTESSIDFMWQLTPQSGNFYGAGWMSQGSSRYHNGSLTGTWTYTSRRVDGITFTVFFNQRSDSNIPTDGSDGSIYSDLMNTLDGIEAAGGWPGSDYFRNFRPTNSDCYSPYPFNSGQLAPPTSGR